MDQKSERKKTLTVIMPCRDEESTVGICIDEAARMMAGHGIEGEIIVADNASGDASAEVAQAHGAKIVYEQRCGYGYAIRRALSEASGDIILIGDCDTTYDFSEGFAIYEMLAYGGYDMVIADRFAGTIERGAMPLSHVLGVKVLSYFGRIRFRTDVKDFHCGLRGLTKEALAKIRLRTGGMEFATEMIAEASAGGLRIGQTAVTLRKCSYPRKSKLNAVRDGARHLHYILFGSCR
ncbi:MAG: glycosyltransferase family 2 protein [Lachnospiraceae bacterium]|nr:glycosyltransferase family 2 protein [Lachnospiraceae bacterium]